MGVMNFSAVLFSCSLLPSHHRGFQVLFKDEHHDSLSDISTSLNMLSTRIGSLCWKILDLCYLSNDLFNYETLAPTVTKMFLSRVEDPMVRAAILIQTFREISSEQSLESKNRLLQKIEKKYNIIDRLRSLQNAGWLSMEDEQLQLADLSESQRMILQTTKSLMQEKKLTERNAALLAQYEYDDSFDDLGLSIAESGTEESEAFGNRVSSGGSEPSAAPKWGSGKTPQFYMKDGKNYSYKVAGAVAVANANEASLVNEAEEDKILGLGRGGNIPLRAVRKLTEYQDQRDERGQSTSVNVNANSNQRENGRNGRGGRGRGRGRGMANRQQPQERVLIVITTQRLIQRQCRRKGTKRRWWRKKS